MDHNAADDMRNLAGKPDCWIKRKTGIICNGYRWRVKKIDTRSMTQNFGVLVNSTTDARDMACYRILIEIIQLIYPQGRSVLLFQCGWVDPIRGVKRDEYGFTLVNLKARWRTSEPFVLAYQAVQVFYLPESKDKHWHVAIITEPRDMFEMEDESVPEVNLLEAHNSTMVYGCLLYTSPSPRDGLLSRMPSSA